MKIGIITLFPEIFPGALGCSVLYKALKDKKWELNIINLKNYARHVDDTPYGGGDGMIIRSDILGKCIDDHINDYEKIIFTVPFGKTWNQKYIKEMYNEKSLLFVCGRYEGIDYRVYEYYSKNYNTEFFSIGDYIMCGGELPAMVMTESLIRTIILRNNVINEESFNNNIYNQKDIKKDLILLEAPQYTKPEIWRNLKVPDVLKSGHHDNIRKWKQEQSLIYTTKYRPDLL